VHHMPPAPKANTPTCPTDCRNAGVGADVGESCPRCELKTLRVNLLMEDRAARGRKAIALSPWKGRKSDHHRRERG
jgi:hypothetical protein